MKKEVTNSNDVGEITPLLKDDEVLDVDRVQSKMRAIHESGINLTYEWRVKQIQNLLRLLTENYDEVQEALYKDLGRERTEAISVELKPLEGEIHFILSNLKEWMKPKGVPSPAVLFPAYSYVERRPLNSPGVLIIGPFNYPIRLVIQPLLGALCGGNPAVIKPSEMTPNVASLMKKLLEKYFPEPGVVQVVLGGPSETTALLQKRWGMVLFTGSERVGKIIATACAQTLTPTILELGGKCPVIVDETVPTSYLSTVAKRVIFAKCMNSGQTCIAPDTLFVHEKHIATLSEALSSEIRIQFGEDPQKGELARIVDTRSAGRVLQLIEDAEKLGSTIAFGGSKSCNVEQKYICPTIVVNPAKTARLLKEEVFGPVMAIVPFTDREHGLNLVKELPGEPLYLYVFAPDEKVFRFYSERFVSGGALWNDVLVQGASHKLPFGGIGTSGYGKHYGKYSFDAFTHAYPVIQRPLRPIPFMEALRTHPYEGKGGALLEKYAFGIPDVPVFPTRKVVVALSLCVPFVVSPSLWALAQESTIQLLETALAALRG